EVGMPRGTAVTPRHSEGGGPPEHQIVWAQALPMVPPLTAKDLVQAIVWLASQRGEALTSLRLVKFLYLADLYWAREHEGQTLTGWPWAFVHFGPFTGNALDTIEAAVRERLIVARPYRSQYTDEERALYLVERDDERGAALAERLPIAVRGA